MGRKRNNSFSARKKRLHIAYKWYKQTNDIDIAYTHVIDDMSKEKFMRLLKKYYGC